MDEVYHFSSRTVVGEIDEQARGWLRAVRLGFNEKDSSDENLLRWWQTASLDGQRWRRADRAPSCEGLGLDALPVATLGSLTHDVNIGGRLLPCDYITDVTVRASDRRRGLLRRLMTDELSQAKQDGLPLASLTSSEGGIYGRFGFGVALRRQRVEVTSTDRFRFCPASERLADQFTVEEASPLAVKDLVVGLHQEFVHTTHGAHSAMAHHAIGRSGEWDWETMAPSSTTRCVVAISGGVPRGAAHFHIDKETVVVDDLVALEPGAELALWRHLARIDLTEKLTFHNLQAGSPLRSALVDARVVRTVADSDQIWLRILNLPALFGARGWFRDAEVVLRGEDPLGLADGCWRVQVRDGRASVEEFPAEATSSEMSSRTQEAEARPGDAAALAQDMVTVDVDALASALLGGIGVTELADAGRIRGSRAGLVALAELLGPESPPRNLTFF